MSISEWLSQMREAADAAPGLSILPEERLYDMLVRVSDALGVGSAAYEGTYSGTELGAVHRIVAQAVRGEMDRRPGGIEEVMKRVIDNNS